MRIKFLSVIVSFLSLSLATTSCLDNDNDIEYSPDAIIKQFAIDTIHGITYNFTINQFGKDGVGEIYNQDSLPLGSDTIIDRILITKLTTASGIITSYNPVTKQDTLFNIADSMDLRNPFTVKVWSLEAYANGGNGPIKQYNIKVNVHKQDPDSMQWAKMQNLPSNALGAQKAVILNKNDKEYIYVYTANAAYKGEIANKGASISWANAGRTRLPANAALTSLINYEGVLYATTGDKKVYQSADGESWTENTTLGNNVDLLLTAFPKNSKNLNENIAGLAGIIDGKFGRTDKDLTQWNESTNTVPDDFPDLTKAISSTVYLSSTNIQTAMIMGNNVNPKDTASIAWSSQDGLEWVQLPKNSNNSYCPKLINPSIIHYNNAFYAFGGPFGGFYKSLNGIAWYEADKKFWMPAEFKDRSDYSMVVGENQHIWIMWSNGEVWRGRLNKLGFDSIIR